MDVSFTNVLEGARQYFQGLPVPSTGGTTSSTNHDLTTSSASTTSSTTTVHDHGTVSSVAPTQSSTNSMSSGNHEPSRYSNDIRPPSTENGASSTTFWSPQVEPYPPQPTRVEVPDTRPADEGSSLEPSSSESRNIVLTEMQPSSKLTQKHTSNTSSSNDHHFQSQQTSVNTSQSPHSNQAQPPPQARSPAPVYQQLGNINKSSYGSTEVLPSHSSSYSTSDRQPTSSATIITQRTQYYPRYHHPDITKSAPVPFTQNSVYQSANVASTTTSSMQHIPPKPTPVEQTNSSVHCPPSQQQVPSSYGSNSVVPPPSSIGGLSSYQPPVSIHSYHPSSQHPQNRVGPSATTERPSLQNSGGHSSYSSSSSSSAINPCSPRHNGSHIPSSPQNLPGHIPPSHLLPAHHSQHQQHQQHASRISGSSIISNPYGTRIAPPHGGVPSSVPSSHSQQMPPPMNSYLPVASPHEPPHHTTPSPHRQSPHVSTLHNPHASSPHHTPSPHNSFQPHSPTYPPPPRSTPHSYTLPPTSQHYQTGYATNPYAPPPQSSYHSFQKSPQPQAQGSYYSQPSRPHNQPYVQQQVGVPPHSTCSSGVNGPDYQQNKSITYNGADTKRNSMDAYVPYRSSSTNVPRAANTHNLPPIAALSSYHSTKRESMGKAQSIQRQRMHSMSVASKVPVATPPNSMIPPSRISDYPTPIPMNHAIPVNGRTTTVSSAPHSRYSGQQSYSPYATTIAPSHHGNNSSSTTVTSIGATARSSVHPLHAYPSSDVTSRMGGSSYHHPPVRTSENYSKEYSYHDSSSSSNQTSATSVAASSSQANGVRKRESPLDLSVKTVKTSADSTAQDDAETTSTDKHVSSSNLVSSRSNGTRAVLPPLVQGTPPPPAVSYAPYDVRTSSVGGRNPPVPPVPIRTSTSQTVCAPKVDFLPDFNSTPLRHHHQTHESAVRSRSSQHLYPPPPQLPQHATNTTPLPHMSTFKKSSLPTTSMYDASQSSSYLAANETPRSLPRYPPPMVDPARIAPTTLPPQDYPSDPAKYYVDGKSKYNQSLPQRDNRAPSKRAGDPIYGAGSPTKQSRLDPWRVAIDKQIQQKLSTARALHEQHKRQEMTLPVALPNGTLIAANTYEQRSDSGYSSSESTRYQQAYCDKRNYPESTVVCSSPPYGHPVATKPTNVHAPSQQLPCNQTSYPNYRQNQRVPCTTGSIAPGTQNLEQPSNTGADKRVLSLLRNSLENKQQREEQINSQQPLVVNHNQQSFQNKVVAPVEPKTNIGRHNLSPFTAASLLERNSNTPPHYKFHVPRAVDSITQEAPRSLYGSRVNASATLPGKEALLGPRGTENQIPRDKDDGLAAILAAKIRTKAELKQVGTGQFIAKPPTIPPQDTASTPKEVDSTASTSTPQSCSSAGSPPKLTREKTPSLPPRRRLFSRTEEENAQTGTVPTSTSTPTVASTMPPRASGFRSSSETSVFDFRESDSEGEMPVLERQTLEEMRRDRKQLSKVQPPVPLNDAMCMGIASSMDLVKIELKENDKIGEVDSFWTAACDKFMEQLRTGDAMKRRGRKKKVDGTSPKVDDLVNESSKEADGNMSLPKIKPEDIKKEVLDIEPSEESKNESLENKEDETSTSKDVKPELKTERELKKEKIDHSDDDSDEVPLIKRAAKKRIKKEESDGEEELITRKRRIRRGSRIKLESSSGSDSSSEDSDGSMDFGQGSSVADRLRARKRSGNNAEAEGMKLRSRNMGHHKTKSEKEPKSSNSKSSASQKVKPKPLFGDGSDFRPGWEEEVYDYKKSLRMPPRLITVSRPSRFHRLSTSLPDLDPGSPALSVSMDSSDVYFSRKRLLDSDVESNYSFSISGFGVGSKIDDEEATSSTTVSCPPKSMKYKTENNSIVDVLAQKVGTSRRELKRCRRDRSEKSPKDIRILPKGSNELELLPTPSLTPLMSSETSKSVKGKAPVRNNRSLSPIKMSDSYLLGYFRKETVNNFRDTFKNNHALPNEFSTFILKSRTRTETRVLKKQATIREVFGEDRPASAPPMQNHEDTSQDDDSQNETHESTVSKTKTLKQKVVSRLRNAGILRSHKAIANSKRHLLIAKRRKDLLKSLAEKKLQRIKTEIEEETTHEETNDTQTAENNDLEDDNNESEVPNKKKLKLRSGRRKFRSGFDYIRKKKKPLKKDETLPKERKRHILSRPSPECIADIQSEIRTWVIKKGVGETVLHRAARLGYTDVTAYCLEKLNSPPSPKDNAGYTPLHEACSKGHLEIAKLLLSYGANVSESANGGIRPLHEAAENGATELVRLLLSYGADPLLATYSGQTPLMMAVDTEAYSILEQHLDDIQGRPSTPWCFGGPSSIFDPEDTGYNPLDDPPMDSPEPQLEEVEMEVSDVNLPVLFSLTNDTDKWVLLQDLMAALKIKSRDALLRQINPKPQAGPPALAHRDVMKELKLPDFLEQSRCCHLLSGGERINVRASKVTLIKYNDKVRSLLNVERVVINLR